ncbi:MAG: LPS-assembly protein LptD [Oligoflexia bacterium]|nr:LPS-assembly protein LptD [Oligoflexia bacterium]
MVVGSAQAAASPVTTVDADRIELLDGVVVGEGDVRARFGQDTVTAARFALDPDRGELELWEGTWSRPAGRAKFGHAVIALRGEAGQISEASILGADGRLHISGETLTWGPDGTLAGKGLRLTTCACESPLWEFDAARVRVDDRAARFRGGVLRLCGLPVLPLPAGRLPLRDRASGFLPPDLGFGQDGLVVGLPVYLLAGPQADITLTPELRTQRGERLLMDTRWSQPGGGGRLRVAGGWDKVDQDSRGALDLEQAWADGIWRLGTDARVESDQTYLADYGGSFLSRALPFAETRGVAAARGLGTGLLGATSLRVEHDSFQSLTDSSVQDQQLGAASLRLAGQRLGPVAVEGGARVDAIGQGTAAWDVEGPATGRVEADLRLEAGHELGPLRLEAALSGVSRAWTDGQPWLEGQSVARAWLPGWMALGSGRLITELGFQAAASARLGSADVRLPVDQPLPAWSLGPAATARLLTLGGVPVSAGGWLALTDTGLAPDGWIQAERGPWQIRGSLDRDLQDARVAYDDGVLALAAGLASAPGALSLLQSKGDASWRLPGVLSQWRPGYHLLVDLVAGQSLQQGPTLGFSSRCGCLDAALGAAWSPGRSGLQLLDPGALKPQPRAQGSADSARFSLRSACKSGSSSAV